MIDDQQIKYFVLPLSTKLQNPLYTKPSYSKLIFSVFLFYFRLCTVQYVCTYPFPIITTTNHQPHYNHKFLHRIYSL